MGDTKPRTDSERMAAQYLALKAKNHATKILKQEQIVKAGYSKNMMRQSHCISVLIVGKTTICEVT